MSDVVIRVENLGKKYRIQHQQRERYTALRDVIAHRTKSFFRKVPSPSSNSQNLQSPISNFQSEEEFWALKDVSFEVKEGEVIGIIGRNGAGKSTLMKILSRITELTVGSVRIRGRVASLLEVGTGFHPELTGRENVYLNGAILGMTRAEIANKFDEIIAFAEVEKFLDTPVKHYSSGMYMRLAFAVSAYLEPEILVVDEVLAVGDAAFQKKCLGRMQNVAEGGRTILFVSHNMTAIKQLCNRAIWMERGNILEIGETGSTVDQYLQKGASQMLERVWIDPVVAPGNDCVRLHHVSLNPCSLEPIKSITVKTAIQFKVAFWNYLPNKLLNLSFVLYNIEGVPIFNTGSAAQVFPNSLIWGSFEIPGNFLNDGLYTIRLLIVKDTSVVLFDQSELLMFEVQDSERTGAWYGKWIGSVRPHFDWKLFIDTEGIR